MTARQFGRDTGDTYGRHALRVPGGDNRQIDVALILNAHMAALLNEFDESYVGVHRMAHAVGLARIGNVVFALNPESVR